MSEKARLKCTVYVGGLDQAVSMQTLAEAFVPFGEVVDITLPKPDVPNSNDLHRGFGYVEFHLPEDAKEAMDNMDGSELYGRTIKVAPAKPPKDSSEGLGSKTAIWEQVRCPDQLLFSTMYRQGTDDRCTGGLSGQVRRERRRQDGVGRGANGSRRASAGPDAGSRRAGRRRTETGMKPHRRETTMIPSRETSRTNVKNKPRDSNFAFFLQNPPFKAVLYTRAPTTRLS